MVFTGAIFLPISEHHYTLQAAKRIFMAKTNDPKLFQDKGKGRMNTENNKKVLKYTDEKMVDLFSSKFEKIVDKEQ